MKKTISASRANILSKKVAKPKITLMELAAIKNPVRSNKNGVQSLSPT
tara:strand:+ start:384 stop:527 length:144 start_codon:yes stop_codon:yes gene_type:complete